MQLCRWDSGWSRGTANNVLTPHGNEEGSSSLSAQTRHRLKGEDAQRGRDAYQSDHGGSGSGARYDVQVVGQVELKG